MYARRIAFIQTAPGQNGAVVFFVDTDSAARYRLCRGLKHLGTTVSTPTACYFYARIMREGGEYIE